MNRSATRLNFLLGAALSILMPLSSYCGMAETPPVLDSALADVSADRIRGHMALLANDVMEGRRTGSRGYELASTYVMTRFDAIGLEPAGDGGGWYQSVPFRKASVIPEKTSIRVVRKGSVRALDFETDFIASPNFLGKQTSAEGPVVFVGNGVTAPELGHDDYAPVDVRGKIVLIVSRGAPERFPSDQRAYYSSTAVKERNAAAHGAVGILWLRNAEQAKRVPWNRMVARSRSGRIRWVDPDGNVSDTFPSIRFQATLSQSGSSVLFSGAVKTLREMMEAAARGTIVSFELPVVVRAEQASRSSAETSPNVIGMVRGSDPVLSGEFVVFTAHLDHLGVGEAVEGDRIRNGAYDNASGVASLLEVARAFTNISVRPARSILFIALTGEEEGLQGSDYFVAHPTVPLQSMVAAVNLDMFLTLHPVRDIVAFGAEHSSLHEIVSRAAEQVGWRLSPDFSPEEVLFIRSDQFSFVRSGIPAVFLVSGLDGPQGTAEGRKQLEEWLRTIYHSPRDDMRQSFDFPSMVTFARMNILIGWAVAISSGRPTWNQGDFFGEKFGHGTK